MNETVEAKFFRGLGDPTRLEVLRLLLDEGEMPISRILTAIGLSQSRLTPHLSCLRACGYLATRKEGRFTYYRVADTRVAQLLELAARIIEEHTGSLTHCPIIDDFHPRQDEAPCCSPDDDADAGSFGPWLHTQLQRQGLGVREFAAGMGISDAAVRRWLYRGGRPLPELRPRVARVLGLPAEEVRYQARVVLGEAPRSSFAAWLDAELQARDWTQAALARRLGVEVHAVTAWFARGVLPRQATLLKLAEVLEVPVSSIQHTAGRRAGRR